MPHFTCCSICVRFPSTLLSLKLPRGVRDIYCHSRSFSRELCRCVGTFAALAGPWTREAAKSASGAAKQCEWQGRSSWNDHRSDSSGCDRGNRSSEQCVGIEERNEDRRQGSVCFPRS